MGLLSWLFGKKKKEEPIAEPITPPAKPATPAAAPAQEPAKKPEPVETATVAQEAAPVEAAPVAQEAAPVEAAPVAQEAAPVEAAAVAQEAAPEEAPAPEAEPALACEKSTEGKKRAAILVGNNLMVTEDGQDHCLEGFRNNWVYMDNEAFKVSGLCASVTAKEPGTYYQTVTGTGVVENAKGEDVTGQFRITVKPGILVIRPKAE